MTIITASLDSSFAYLPKNSVSNLNLYENYLSIEMKKKIGRNEFLERTKRFTGVSQRRFCDSSQAASDLAASAMMPALYSNPQWREKIAGLIVATTSGDYTSPATANWVHRALKLSSQVYCMDVASSCTSFFSAFRASSSFLENGKSAVIIASEAKHKFLNPNDPRTLPLFSDGAGGVYLENSSVPSSIFQFCYQKIDSHLADHILTPAGGSRHPFSHSSEQEHFLRFLEPKMMFAHTVKSIVSCIESAVNELTKQNKLKKLRYIFVHQANLNILKEVRKSIGAELAVKIPSLMSDVGNMVCASFPVLRSRTLFLESLILLESNRVSCSEDIISAIKNEVFQEKTLSVKAFQSGTLYYAKNQNEKIYIYDDNNSPLEESWIAKADEDEIQFIIENIERNKKNKENHTLDLWIGAGGGFQTVGIIHERV
jgi:3-oxoacyl-[acyl-carrier-protein] synthase III